MERRHLTEGEENLRDDHGKCQKCRRDFQAKVKWKERS
jgi:hypothetical protein